MATDLKSSIENLLAIIASASKNSDRTDAYLTIFSHFLQNKDVTASCVRKDVDKVLPIIQDDLKGKTNTLKEAAISFLGQCFALDKIFGAAVPANVEKTLKALVEVATTEEKSVCIRALWCLSHQNLPPSFIKSHVASVIKFFASISSTAKKADLVTSESLNALKRLSKQCPSGMQANTDEWFNVAFNLVLSELPKIRENALDLIEVNLEMLQGNKEIISSYLIDQLNNEDVGETLRRYFENNTCPVHVVNTWACVLRLLQQNFFKLEVERVVNPLLKIAEKAFLSRKSEVNLALNNLWRALIDATFSQPGRFSKKMEKIFLQPLQVKQRNEILANESLKTNWHFICKLDKNINDYLGKTLIPILTLYFSENTESRRQSTGKKPFIVQTSTKLLASEMLVQLLMIPEDRCNYKHFKLERFKGPALTKENFLKHFDSLLKFTTNATRNYSLTHENEASQLWLSLFMACRCLPKTSEHIRGQWKEILLVISNLLDEKICSTALIMKLLLMLPEHVLDIRVPSLQDVSCGTGLVSVFVTRLLFHDHMLENSAYREERYFILFEQMVNFMTGGISNQLHSIQIVFTLFEEKNSLMSKEPMIVWRTWSTLTHLLEKYISRTSDVNQGGALHYQFPALLSALMFPLHYIDTRQLRDGARNEMLKVWSELYGSFNRAVNLLPGVEDNLSLEELFCCVSKFLHERKETPVEFVKMLLQMAKVCTATIVWSTSGSFTPTKLAQRRARPLANFKSFADVCKQLIAVVSQNMQKNESRANEKNLTEILDLLETFFTSVSDTTLLVEWGKHLSPSLAGLFQLKMSNKSLENLITKLFNAYESNALKMVFVSQLEYFEQILCTCFKSERKTLRNRTAKFWNKTFGKCSNLVYSANLKEVLSSVSTSVKLILPNFESRVLSPDIVEETTQCFSPSKSPKLKLKPITAKSPVKVFGSFLKNSPSVANKALSGNSPSLHKTSAKKSSAKSINFVEIADSPKRRRLLTEHQKEKLRERKDVPVMYNNLDQSQDTSLFKLLTQDTSSLSQLPSQQDENEQKDQRNVNQKCYKVNNSSLTDESAATIDSNFIVPESMAVEESSNKSIVDDDCPMSDSELIPSSQTDIGRIHDNSKISILSPAGVVSRTESPAKKSRLCREAVILVEDPLEDIIPLKDGPETIDISSSETTNSTKASLEDDNKLFNLENTDKIIISEENNTKKDESTVVEQKTNTDKVSQGNNNIEITSTFKNKDSSVDAEVVKQMTKEIDSNDEDIVLSSLVRKRKNEKSTDKVEQKIVAGKKRGRRSKRAPSKRRKSEGSVLSSVLGESVIANPLTFVKDEKQASEETHKEASKRDEFSFSQDEASQQARQITNTFNRKIGYSTGQLPRRLTRQPDQDVTKEDETLKKTSDEKDQDVSVKEGKGASETTTDTSKEAEKDSLKEPSEPVVHNVQGVAQNPVLESNSSSLNPEKQGPITLKLAKASLKGPLPSPQITKSNQPSSNQASEIPTASPVTNGILKKRSQDSSLASPSISKTRRVSFQLPEDSTSRLVEENSRGYIALKRAGLMKSNDSKEDTATPDAENVDPTSKNLETENKAANAEAETKSATSTGILSETSHHIVESPIRQVKVVKTSSPLPLSSPKIFIARNSHISSPTPPPGIHSPKVSATTTSILKKRPYDSPSPPQFAKVRCVSFNIPNDTKDDSTGNQLDDSRGYVNANKKKPSSTSCDGPPGNSVYPQLTKCTEPIERVLHSLTFSRGIGHLVRAQNILTIGDLSSLTEVQVESLPIRSPKVATVKHALRTFEKGKSIPKSPLVTKSNKETTTPPKEDDGLAEAALLTTPSRRFDSVKPTSLFADIFEEAANKQKQNNTPNNGSSYTSSITPLVIEMDGIATLKETPPVSPIAPVRERAFFDLDTHVEVLVERELTEGRKAEEEQSEEIAEGQEIVAEVNEPEIAAKENQTVNEIVAMENQPVDEIVAKVNQLEDEISAKENQAADEIVTEENEPADEFTAIVPNDMNVVIVDDELKKSPEEILADEQIENKENIEPTDHSKKDIIHDKNENKHDLQNKIDEESTVEPPPRSQTEPDCENSQTKELSIQSITKSSIHSLVVSSIDSIIESPIDIVTTTSVETQTESCSEQSPKDNLSEVDFSKVDVSKLSLSQICDFMEKLNNEVRTRSR